MSNLLFCSTLAGIWEIPVDGSNISPSLLSSIGLACLFVLAFSWFGFGCLLERLARISTGAWPTRAGLGMAVFIFLGGVLNAAHLANRGGVLILTVLGCIAAFCAKRRVPSCKQTLCWSEKISRVAVILPLCAILGFTIVTQLAPRSYNYHDDFQKYFVHVVRMLQTGTLAGSPLSALGSETLGGQAFLQSFIAAVLPIEYINGVDAVLGLGLVLAMIAQLSWTNPRTRWSGAACVILAGFIHPQYVNISSLYTGSALVLTALCITVSAPGSPDRGIDAIIFGLICAALIAAKPTFLLFIVLFSIARSLTAFTGGTKVDAILKWLAIATGSTFLFLTPWFIVYRHNYITAWTQPLPLPKLPPAPPPEAYEFLSTHPLFNGGNMAFFMGTAVMALVAGVCAARCARADERKSGLTALAAGATAFSAIVLSVLTARYFTGREGAVRYTVPILIALTPATLALWSSLIPETRPPSSRWLPLVAALSIVVLSTPIAWDRAQQLMKWRTGLSYIYNTQRSTQLNREEMLKYSKYNQDVLHRPFRDATHHLQSYVPAGARIITWIDAPFYLDFNRNAIFDLDFGGIRTPWARLPQADYLIWQYAGFASPSKEILKGILNGSTESDRVSAQRLLDFADEVISWGTKAKVIYNQDGIIILKIPKSP